MVFFNSNNMEDAGYFSDSESTSDYHPVLREQPIIVDVETDIANYNKRQLELYAKDSHGSVNKDLGFFPPHSNKNPRTSQEIQRLREYSKPLYKSNADFLTAAGLASRISHHQHGHSNGHNHLQQQQQQQQQQHQHQQRHQSNALQANQQRQQQQQHQQADRSTGVYLGHEYLRGRSPSLGRLSVMPASNHRSNANVQSFRQPSFALPLNKDPVTGSVQQQQQQQSLQGLRLKDVATHASIVGTGYGSEYSPTKQNLFRSLQRQMVKEEDDDDDDDDDHDDDRVEDKEEIRRDRDGSYRVSANRMSWSWSKEDLTSSMQQQQQQQQHQQKHQQSNKSKKSHKHSKRQERADRFSSSTAQPRHSIPAMDDVESDDEDTRATQRSKVKSHKKDAKGRKK